MTRLCLLSVGRAEGRAEILLLPGWDSRSVWLVRAAPVPIPLTPTSTPNQAEGLPPALGQAGTPLSALPVLPCRSETSLCWHSPNRNQQHRGGGGWCMGCPAWPRLPGRAGPGGEVRGGSAAPRRHRCCQAGIQVVLPKGSGQSGLHRDQCEGLAGQGPPGSAEVAFSMSLCANTRSFLVQLVQEDCQGRREAPRAAACCLAGGKIAPRTAAIPVAGRDPGAGMRVRGLRVPELCPRSLVPARAASLPEGTDVSCDLMKMLLASGFI